MLGVKTYEREYIQSTRARIDREVARYRDLAAVGASLRGAGKTQFDSTLGEFEPIFFNDLVLVLDHGFVHRLRGVEGKDGNALNEVRVLSMSLLTNDGRLAADSQIKLDPATSVLGYAVGDPIAVRESEFGRLARAFFAEIAAKYS